MLFYINSIVIAVLYIILILCPSQYFDFEIIITSSYYNIKIILKIIQFLADQFFPVNI